MRLWEVIIPKLPPVPYNDYYVEQYNLYNLYTITKYRLAFGANLTYILKSNGDIYGSFISKKDFDSFIKNYNSTKIIKIVRNFNYDGLVCNLHYFLEPRFGLIILESEKEMDWLELGEDITNKNDLCL